MYAFKFDAFDKPTDEETSRKNNIDVIVVAANEEDALEAAKRLATREVYKLSDITELSETLHPVSLQW